MAKTLNHELVNYIEKHIKKGIHINQIKKTLQEVGHPISAIEDAAAFVISKQPRRIPAFMIIYGIVLILLISFFGWFVWYKATEHVQYTATISEIEQNKSYEAMSDVSLLKLAAAGDMKACEFIEGHNLRYGCLERYWDKNDCSYEILLNNSNQCIMNKAVEGNNISLCFNIDNTELMTRCYISIFENVVKMENITICQTNNECIQYYLRMKPSFELCLQYFDDEICAFLISNITKNSSYCNNISDKPDRSDCMKFAIKTVSDVTNFCKIYSDVDISSSDLKYGGDKESYCVYIYLASLFNLNQSCESIITQPEITKYLSEFAEIKNKVNSLASDVTKKKFEKINSCV